MNIINDCHICGAPQCDLDLCERDLKIRRLESTIEIQRVELEAKIDELKKDLAYSEMEKTYYKTSGKSGQAIGLVSVDAYLLIQKQNNLLKKAQQYLKEGHATFTPNVTNSHVLDLIEDIEKLNLQQ